MTKKKKPLSTFGYSQLRKYISHYHHFSFPTPRKGKGYTPQQKGAITRKYNQLVDLIKSVRLEQASFIFVTKKNKKTIPWHDGVKTNKGFFFKYPFASVRKIRMYPDKKSTYQFVIDYRKIRFSQIMKGTTSDVVMIWRGIPDYIQQSVERISEYCIALRERYGNEVLLNAYGTKYSTRMDINEFLSGSGKLALYTKEELEEEEELTDDELVARGDKKFVATIMAFFME